MDLLLKIAVYAVLALSLAVLNVVFVRSAYRAFAHHRGVKAIAPFEVVGLGKEHDAQAHGAALARMLRARLMRIRDEMASLQALAAGGGGDAAGVTPQVQPSVTSLDLPYRIFAPVDLQLEIAGVQVGGLLARLQTAAAERDTLRFVVRYNAKAVTVAGDDGSRDFSLWLDEAERTDSQIVEQIAYALVHRQVGTRIPEVNALDADEFQSLLKALYDLSQLNARIARGRLVAGDAFANILPTLDHLVSRAPRWRELIRVAAQTSELAGQSERALELYLRERSVASDTRDQWLAQKIDALQINLAPRYATTTPATTPGATPVSSPAPATRPAGSPEDRIRELLGVRPGAMSRPIAIGIVGGPPLPASAGANVRVLPAPGPRQEGLDEYASTMLVAARIVAPDATYVFAPISGFSQADLAVALEQLMTEKVDLILFTFGSGTVSEILRDAFADVAEGQTLVVAAAGNDPKMDSTARELDPQRALVVGAVDLRGKRARFSNEGNVWAPGSLVPVGPGMFRDGTTYSATLAAAVAARLLAEEKLSPAEVVRRLRDTSVQQRDGERVLNLENALKRGT